MSQLGNLFSGLLTSRKRLKVALFSLLAFSLVGISLASFVLSLGKPYIGAVFSKDDQGWTVVSLDTNGLSIGAGIKVGDRLVEINGQPAQVFLKKYEKAGVVFGRLVREFTVVDANGHLRSVSLEDGSPSWQSVAEIITWFIVCLIFWSVGFFVFFRRPKNQAALLLCLCGLSFGLALSGNMAVERTIPTALWFEVAATVIGPWLLLHFFIILPEERKWLQKQPLLYLIYLPAVITLGLFPLIGFADGQPLPGFRSFRVIEYGIGFLAVAIVAISNYVRFVSPRTRQQMKIVLIGCLAALIPFLVLNVIPATIWSQKFIPSGFNILFISFIPIGMGYAVITQKLMDIDVIIRRGVVYGLITVMMGIILSGGIFLIVAFRQSIGIGEQILLALALGAIATTLFGPTKRRLEILVDKLFYKDRYDYRQTIQSFANSVNSLKDLTDISRLTVGTTFSTLNLSGACLWVKSQSGPFELKAAQGIFVDADKQRQLLTLIPKRDRMTEFPNSASTLDPEVAFLIPLIVGDEEVGILGVSQKASRQVFSSDDIYLLQGIISVAAAALRGARLVRDVSLRETFVSIASHELRTPLTSIVGFADLLLLRDPPADTRRKWLTHILQNGRKITAMVDDLLNVTRIQSGNAQLKLEAVNLAKVLKEQLSIVQGASNKHKFVIDLEPDLPDAQIDRDKFAHVIGNLLSNAVKYSPNGGRITLSAYTEPGRQRIIVSVADEGIGISPEDKHSLFITFHRIQRPETQGISGSGLGLFIAKEWTEAMGGEIWFESEFNKGTTFFVGILMKNSQLTN